MVTDDPIMFMQSLGASKGLLHWAEHVADSQAAVRVAIGLLMNQSKGAQMDKLGLSSQEMHTEVDLWSCMKLMQLDEFRESRNLVAQIDDGWDALIARWDELTAIVDEEMPNGPKGKMSASRSSGSMHAVIVESDQTWIEECRLAREAVASVSKECSGRGWNVWVLSKGVSHNAYYYKTGVESAVEVEVADGGTAAFMVKVGEVPKVVLLPQGWSGAQVPLEGEGEGA